MSYTRVGGRGVGWDLAKRRERGGESVRFPSLSE